MRTKLRLNLCRLQTVGLLFALFCCGALSASGQTGAPVTQLWDRTFGGSSDDHLTAIAPTTDGGFLLGGFSNSEPDFDKSEDDRQGSYDYWVIRIDAQGVKLWDKTFGGNEADHLKRIIALPDGGFLLGGYSVSNAGFEKSEDARGGGDYWLVRIDAQGAILWDKTFGGEGVDQLLSMVALPDGGFLLGGYSNSNASFEKSEDARGVRSRNDYWVARIDAQGNQLWDKTYGGDGQDDLQAMVATADGGFLLGGYSNSNASFEKSEDRRGYYDYWIVRADAQGNKLWDKTYGGDERDELYSIVAAAGGGFLLCGRSESNQGFEKSEDARGGQDYWVARIDAQGVKLWDKTYGGEEWDQLASSVEAADGGFLLAGWSSSNAGFEKSEDARGGQDYWVARIDAQGNKLWDKTYGGNEDDLLNAMVATPDDGLLFGGVSASEANFEKSEDERYGSTDYWVVSIKEEPLPNALPAAFHAKSLTASVRPNPFSGLTTFGLNLENPADLTLEVRDLSGRLVAAETFAAPQGNSERVFDASALSAGAYFYTLSAKDGRKAEGKLIVK